MDSMSNTGAVKYEDGEVIRVDTDGCLVLYNAASDREYNCGQTLEEFGIYNLFPKEKERLGV